MHLPISPLLEYLGRLRSQLLSPKTEAAQKPPQAIFVVALDPVSADWFHDILAVTLRNRESRVQQPRLRLIRMRGHNARSIRRLQQLARDPFTRVLAVGEFGRWLWALPEREMLYLRPGVLVLKNVLGGIARDPAVRDRVSRLLSLDRLLSTYPNIDLETLFHKPQRVAENLEARSGLPFSPEAFPANGGERYRDAVSAVLRIVAPGRSRYKFPMVFFSPGRSYATTVNSEGYAALGDGWSWPESEHTWTDGPYASLVIPVASWRGDRLRLQLDGMLPPIQMQVQVIANGRVAMLIEKNEMPPRDQTIALSLPCPAPDNPALCIELGFSATFCPKEAGISGDPRHLGFALRSFTMTEETQLPRTVRSLIGWRQPRLTLAVSQPPPNNGLNLDALLAESGLTGSLVSVSDNGSDHPGWMENGRSIVRPQFAAQPERGSGDASPDAEPRLSRTHHRLPISRLRRFAFRGALSHLIAELALVPVQPDLVLLAAGDLLGDLLEALEPAIASPTAALPDIAVCTEHTGFFERCFWQLRERYERTMPRFAMAVVDPELICFASQHR